MFSLYMMIDDLLSARNCISEKVSRRSKGKKKAVRAQHLHGIPCKERVRQCLKAGGVRDGKARAVANSRELCGRC